MLWVKIVNDGTGTELEGNYDVQVGINHYVLYEGRIEGLSGWKRLLLRMWCELFVDGE